MSYSVCARLTSSILGSVSGRKAGEAGWRVNEGSGSGDGLPASTERILRIWADAAPHAAARARAALEVIFADMIHSREPDTFARSTLTMTGSPFEPAFSCSSPGVRYTADPAPREVDLRQRLDYVLALLERLQAPAAPVKLTRRLSLLQSRGELRYGAQLGGRHDASSDRYKLYIEVPAEAAAEADVLGEELLGSLPVLNVPGRNARITLVGIDLASHEMELYYCIDNLHPWEIRTLMMRANAAERAPEVLAMLGECRQREIRHQLPGSTWGFSYCRHADGTIAFSIFTFARTLIGADCGVRNAVLAMGRRHAWDLSAYEQMSKPLERHRGVRNHHGVFGLIAKPESALAAWIGLAPPETGQ